MVGCEVTYTANKFRVKLLVKTEAATTSNTREVIKNLKKQLYSLCQNISFCYFINYGNMKHMNTNKLVIVVLSIDKKCIFTEKVANGLLSFLS